MPIWVPELDMLYALVPRTGSSGFGHYLQLRYDAIDLASSAAVDAGLVSPRSDLCQQSDFAQLSRHFRAPVAKRRVVRVAGVRNPADSLFSAWWNYSHTFPQRLERIAELDQADQDLLRSEAVAARMDQALGVTFSDWVLACCQSITEPNTATHSRLDELRHSVWAFARHRGAKVPDGATSARRLPTIWYEGATEYIRVEDCNADWERICRQRGWSHRGQIPISNATVGRPADYWPYLTEEAAGVLRRAYRRMISRFGYEIRSNSAG